MGSVVTGNTTSNGFREMALCLELIQSGTLNRDQLGVILVAVEQQIKKQEEN